MTEGTDHSGQAPAWWYGVVHGRPELVANRALVEELIGDVPTDPKEARRRLHEAGYTKLYPEGYGS